MPKVVFTHAVVDVDRWLKGNADRQQLGSDVVDYVAGAAPPAEMQAQMDEHGVVPPITTYIQA